MMARKIFPADALTRGDKLKITRLRRLVLDWYASHGREFPWRRDTATEYERICVEVLLQRTRAETVAAFYDDFFGRFTGWSSLARAPLSELEETLRAIGLWQRRARALKGLAEYAEVRSGQFPSSEAELAAVPAVGQYVANAILLFQHGKNRPLLDVNMARVLERYVRPRRLVDIRHDPWLQSAAHWLVRGEDPVSVNWAVLDLASALCHPRGPACIQCELARGCGYGKRA